MIVDGMQAPGDRPAANPRATRSVVMARNGIIATSQPLASAAGLRVLQEGGNAIDAAVTAAAVLSVVEPTMNGVGGDLFAIVYDAKTKTVHGLNASGRAPAAATLEEFKKRKLDAMPLRGELSVSVPGVVDGWNELLTKHGTHHAGAGARAGDRLRARRATPVSEIIADQWKEAESTLVARSGRGRDVPARRPCAGAGRRLQEPAAWPATLEQIAQGRTRRVLQGPDRAGDRRRHADAQRPARRPADLAAHHADWVEPISTTYRGYEVLELPPNTQGVAALEMLNILEGFDLKALGHN